MYIDFSKTDTWFSLVSLVKNESDVAARAQGTSRERSSRQSSPSPNRDCRVWILRQYPQLNEVSLVEGSHALG